MALLLDDDRFEPPLKHVSNTPMASIEGLGVDPVELLHPSREICVRRLYQQVVMIGHQAIGITDPTKTIDHVREDIKKAQPIVIIEKDRLPSIASRRKG